MKQDTTTTTWALLPLDMQKTNHVILGSIISVSEGSTYILEQREDPDEANGEMELPVENQKKQRAVEWI